MLSDYLMSVFVMICAGLALLILIPVICLGLFNEVVAFIAFNFGFIVIIMLVHDWVEAYGKRIK